MSSLLSDLRIASSRKAKHNKKRSSIVSEDFHWSLQRNSPDQKRYLAKVPDGLCDAANKFNVSILPEDILPWIKAHEGHCPLYINPNSIAGLTIRNQKRFQEKDIDDIKRMVEESTTTHRFFAPSPRFNNLNLSATTEYNYEESICNDFDFVVSVQIVHVADCEKRDTADCSFGTRLRMKVTICDSRRFLSGWFPDGFAL
jgi:hypothetical protein